MKIGELSDLTEVPPRMIRYYEQQGLLAPQRAKNGYRSYTQADVERVRRVRSLIRTGVPTRLSAAILDMERPGSSWSEACSRDFAQTLAGELRTIEDKIGCLELSRGTIRNYLERTGHGEVLDP